MEEKKYYIPVLGINWAIKDGRFELLLNEEYLYYHIGAACSLTVFIVIGLFTLTVIL